MKRNARRVLVMALLAAGLVLGAASARADQSTPLWGWDDDGFSLWPVLYVGQGGFSIPGLRWTENSFSVPFIHYENAPKTRFDLTPVYHYTEDQEGFFLGPARDEVNEGEQGIANLLFDLTTLVSNTRQYLGDDPAEYETYREYGRSDMVIPGSEYSDDDDVSLAAKVEEAPPAEEVAEPETPPAPETVPSEEVAPEPGSSPADTM